MRSRNTKVLCALGVLAGLAQATALYAAGDLADIGMSLEAARKLPAVERRGALENTQAAMKSFLDGDVEKDKRYAALLLAGEIRYALADYKGAADVFAEAGKEGKKTPYADDAEFGRIQALEAAGRDVDADKAWAEWLKHYPESALVPEALIARSWNAIRRDSLTVATRIVGGIRADYRWLENDPRVALASSYVAYREGRYADVSVAPSGSPLDAAITYLLALTDEARGDRLKAAARFKEVVDRYPESPLRDYAMIAKANVFLANQAFKIAIDEFGQVVERASNERIRAEAGFRQAAAVYLGGDVTGGTERLREVANTYDGSDVAARAQMLLGETLVRSEEYESAIMEFNKLLSRYFEHSLAAGAQYNVGRCLDALDRKAEATSTYQSVVSGYPTSREAPAAAYLAGVGLLDQNRPMAAVPYFQLVLDRYAQDKGEGTIEFATPERQELVEASLCLLELSYHRAGNLGLLSGVPHLTLHRMPPSKSTWRAYALLIDADALASQGRLDESQAVLDKLLREFPAHQAGMPAMRLLAWTYAQQGEVDKAIAMQDKMLASFGGRSDSENMSSAYLNKAHVLFNEKDYKAAARAYETYLHEFPDHAQRQLALYQAGICYLRLGRDGDAVDRWEDLIAIDPTAEIAEKAWTRAGDLYFRADHYEDARRCYQGLIDNFANSRGAAVGMLRIAQCDYNAGNNEAAIESFSNVIAQFGDHAVAAEAQRGIEQALYKLGQGEGGEERLAQLVERFPSSDFAADAQFEIGLRHYNDKQYEAAAEEFRRVISQFPGYSAADRAHYLMAESYNLAGRSEDATLAYEQFVMFFPESEYRTAVRLQLGAARFAEGDYMRAAIEFAGVLADSTPVEAESAALYNVALCHRMLGEADKALASFEEYRSKYPNDERADDISRQVAEMHEQMGDYKKAIEEYEAALATKPENDVRLELYYRIGTCWEGLQDDDKALASYERATHSKDRENAFRLSAVARCAALHEKMQDYGEALQAYKDLIRHAKDPEIVVAAKARASELEAAGVKQ